MSIQPYQLEPEYSSEEIEEPGSTSEEEDEIGNLESPSGESRRTNTSWRVAKGLCLTRDKG